MGFTLKVHEYAKIPGTMEARLIKERPYIRLSAGDDHVFIQQGRLYYEDGTELKEVPVWVTNAIGQCTSEALEEVGYGVSSEEVSAEPKPKKTVSKKSPEYWRCTECGEAVDTKKKGVHVARHRRETKAMEQAAKGDKDGGE